jgi:hypothetical protein
VLFAFKVDAITVLHKLLGFLGINSYFISKSPCNSKQPKLSYYLPLVTGYFIALTLLKYLKVIPYISCYCPSEAPTPHCICWSKSRFHFVIQKLVVSVLIRLEW